MCLFRPHSDIDVKFFLSLLNGSWGRKQAQRAATGTAHPHVNLTDIKAFLFPLPPTKEQVQIRREVERRFIAADKLASMLNRQLDRAGAVRQSLLREAFAGKLVPQANDEPASALLDRIRAIRKTEAKKPKAKRMPKAKLKSVETLEDLEGLIHKLGKGATPDRLLLAAGLGDDVETFFDLLRAGRDKGTLVVPVGKGTTIKRTQHAN
jgi:type I restriction enzyme S subunit